MDTPNMKLDQEAILTGIHLHPKRSLGRLAEDRFGLMEIKLIYNGNADEAAIRVLVNQYRF